MPLAAGKVVCANEWPRIASAEVRPALGLPGPRSPREAEAGLLRLEAGAGERTPGPSPPV